MFKCLFPLCFHYPLEIYNGLKLATWFQRYHTEMKVVVTSQKPELSFLKKRKNMGLG